MMKTHSKYDNMHQENKSGALKCTNNDASISKYSILLYHPYGACTNFLGNFILSSRSILLIKSVEKQM